MTSQSKELIPLQKKISTLASEASSLIIASPKDMQEATTILSNINKYADSVKEQKETLTKPINLSLKNIRSMFKPLEESYESAIAIIRQKMTQYKMAEDERVRIEEEKITARIKEGKGNLSISKAVEKIDQIERPEKETSTDAGLVQFVATKKFEIIDKSKIPLDYLIPDETAIRKAMKEGIELPGIRYYIEQVPRNFR